jgi:hypothetical protein
VAKATVTRSTASPWGEREFKALCRSLLLLLAKGLHDSEGAAKGQGKPFQAGV